MLFQKLRTKAARYARVRSENIKIFSLFIQTLTEEVLPHGLLLAQILLVTRSHARVPLDLLPKCIIDAAGWAVIAASRQRLSRYGRNGAPFHAYVLVIRIFVATSRSRRCYSLLEGLKLGRRLRCVPLISTDWFHPDQMTSVLFVAESLLHHRVRCPIDLPRPITINLSISTHHAIRSPKCHTPRSHRVRPALLPAMRNGREILSIRAPATKYSKRGTKYDVERVVACIDDSGTCN